MDMVLKAFRSVVNTCCDSMRVLNTVPCVLLLFSVLSACAYGLSVDFSRLRQLRRPFILDKRGESCTGNPCPAWKPFLCKSSSVCIALDAVCDRHPDCPDHFDEEPELCTAKKRPPVETIYEWLERNRKWATRALFSGADFELVAHAFAVSKNIGDFSNIVGLSPSAESNLEEAFFAVMDGDMRPLLKLGMPKGEWYDTTSLFNGIMDGGFEI